MALEFSRIVKTNILPLLLRNGHLFVELEGKLWLIDTGSPSSFGTSSSLSLAGEQFSLETSHLGLNAITVSQFVAVSCSGLLGADVLGRFDHIFDTAGGKLTVSTGELSHTGANVCLDEFTGIPIVTASIGGSDHRMFFDTGAQFSYFQDDSLTGFPPSGNVTDFYPGVGQFETDTYEVPVSLRGVTFILQCGSLPGLLGTTLMMAEAKGIIGNAILRNRTVGYFPRRRTMVL